MGNQLAPKRFHWTLNSSMAIDKTLKPNSIPLFDDEPIEVQLPIFGPNLGLPPIGMRDLSPKFGIRLTLTYSLDHC